jgi:GNAT superfamily N-acetyltransferase
MLTIEQIDPSNRTQLHRFVDLPYHIYTGNKNWVPPIRIDVETALNRKKHPFYEHSEGDFFIATRDGKDVGRLSIAVNNNYNKYHGTKKGQFYYFECDEDFEIAQALFNRAFDWARQRGLDTVIGPKGFAALDGYGMLVEGFEHRQMMTMMNYNPPYYPKFMEQLGFEKEVDFISCYAEVNNFLVPERVHRIAERVLQRGVLNVKRFASKRELVEWAPKIGDTYNRTFVNNWEYAPLTEREVKFVVDNIITIADHRLIKIISHKEDPVGFLFGFADVSAAIQRSKGRLFPFGLLDILLEMRRTDWISVNGAGILPEFQGHGGNALLYSEMEKTVREYKHFKYADMTQVAETAVNMRNDLINLGGKPFKNHRVFRKKI